MRTTFTAALMAAFFLFPGSVIGQTVILDRTVAVKTLKETHGEVQRGSGVTNSGALVELWGTPDGSTWTILLTLPSGQSILIGSGTSWTSQIIKPGSDL